MQVTAEDTTEVGSTEDYFPAGKILQEHGFKWKDFKDSEEALARVRHLCARNQNDHGYEPKAEVIDDVYPEFSKFFFCFGLGKTQTHLGSQKKELSGSSNLKDMKQLENAKAFFEGLGFDGDAGADESTVKIENAKYQELKKELDAAKTACLISANRKCLLAAPLNRRCLHAAPLQHSFFTENMQHIYIYVNII